MKDVKMILAAEALLEKLGYWTGPVDGQLDETSRQALIAFEKVSGRNPDGQLTASEVKALKFAKRPRPRFIEGFHLEIDLTRQVLFVVDKGKVRIILPVSTGNGKLFTSDGWTRQAITPAGKFKVERKIEGIRLSSLGSMHYPMYINKGIAIHGSQFLMVRPSTHGCIAIPMHAAQTLSRVTPLETEVIVYGRAPLF